VTDEAPQGQYDASDPVAVDNAGKEAKRRETEDRETVRVLMSHPKGRDFVYRFLGVCHIWDDCRGADTHDTYFNLGERNIGTWWLKHLEAHPELYKRMIEEQHVLRQARDMRLQKQNEDKDQRDGGTGSD